MKLPLMAAIAALSLYGCASQSANTREASSPEAGAMGGAGSAGTSSDVSSSSSESLNPDTAESDKSAGEASNVSDLEKRDRMDAPTVYEGEATGGSGAADETVKTQDGQKWDVQQNTPTDLGDPQVPAGSVNQNRDPSDDGTGGSGDESSGKSEIKDASGDANADTDDLSTDSKVETDATPDSTH
ncbi:hypothetical protein D7X74_36915 [Corallococcus sp. CA047B]|uniref:hypothetical protein n=1 Tax=Corallococcus sp. CA047B TaxID=2316729 RepID=UPI000EA0A31E|nr:hypothetical protein [Corallococcus sp. CA047B]RKH02681.1 hypothetical protein D7X74_36915 [Corallococcus sp. CA047B]